MQIRQQTNKGLMLPLVLMMVALLSIVCFGVATILFQTSKDQNVHLEASNKNQDLLQSCMERAEAQLRSRSDPSQAHTWTGGSNNTINCVVDGKTVTISVDDVEWNKPH